MLFNSWQFFIFFPVVTILFFLLPHKFRWFHLLTASCIFYAMFIPIYILILFFTIIIDYYAGILIEKAEGANRKLFLTFSIIANVGILIFFKYYNFFAENVNLLSGKLDSSIVLPILSFVLPIGLSFHTFQAMSYTIEVYRGNQKAERHFGIYSLYVMYYPQLVAGPIERPQNIIHQLKEKHSFNQSELYNGLKLMAWGMFKKVVIADRLAVVVSTVYGAPEQYNSVALLTATIFFSFQIFCDFSGYTDIALGASRVMGIKLMENFKRPYHSKTIDEFWKRWHISLSSWFKDYLYITLGGNRVSVPRWYLNLFIVFMVSGFWHGANWTFIIWGALHGIYLIMALATKKIRSTINNALGINPDLPIIQFINVLATFILVSLAWVFFRAENAGDGVYIIKAIFTGWDSYTSLSNISNGLASLGVGSNQLIISLLLIVFLECIHLWQKDKNFVSKINELSVVPRYTFYYFLVFGIILFGLWGDQQFIYFQF